MAWLTAAIGILVFIPILLGTSSREIIAALIVVQALLCGSLAMLARRSTPPRLRSMGVVGAFATVGLAGYATLGFLSAPGVAFAASVIAAGLLLGRRAMFVTTAIVSLLIAAVAALMINDVLVAPPLEDISPHLILPWVRSSALTLILISILGAVVTWTVEHVENANTRVVEESRHRREAEQKVLEAKNLELIAQLAASLAHDVNNQLTVISAWGGLLPMLDSESERQEASDTIAESIDRAKTLTQRMLMLGRQEVRKPRDLPLGTLVENYEPTLRGFMPADVEVQIELHDDVWCHADEAQLHQVLLNLAVNARDAMPKGGTLIVRSSVREGGEVNGARGSIPVGRWAVLEVEDTGTGMSEATLARVFTPFFTTKPVGKGTGLGLATVARVAEANKGHVAVESEVGKGTKISVWLPAIAAGKVDTPEPLLGPFNLRSVRVLLVEDSAQVLKVARRALVNAGCTVVAASDGDEGLARVREGHFDILCSDVVMPGARVLDVVAAFRERNPQAPVLLCSGYVGEELVRRGIQEGSFHFLPKPYTSAALVAQVARLLPTHRAKEESKEGRASALPN